MLPKKLLRCVNTLQIMIAVCGLQLYAQSLDPRTLLHAAAKAAQVGLSKATTVAQVPTAAGDFTSFDVPGAANGTFPQSINPAREITGFYADANDHFHGFLRAPDGTITTFDAPGAFTGVFGTGTFAVGINPAGEITGNFEDANGVHSFLRASSGAFTVFDVQGPSSGTTAAGINNGGMITGTYSDASGNGHNFRRDRNGTFTSFDPAFVTNLSGIINPAGTITGYFFEGTISTGLLVHSFVRSVQGTVTIFDAPNVCKTSNGTFATGIDPAGVVVGTWFDPNCADFHGFLRDPNGTFTSFDVPGAQDTGPAAINASGTITGIFFDAIGIHDFLRSPAGTFTKFDTPIPGSTPEPTSINPAAAVTGMNFDANSLSHGFLFQPR